MVVHLVCAASQPGYGIGLPSGPLETSHMMLKGRGEGHQFYIFKQTGYLAHGLVPASGKPARCFPSVVTSVGLALIDAINISEII